MPDYNRIKVVLVEKKRTAKQLAEHLGLQPNAVSRWCQNRNQPEIPTLFKIAEYLEVSPRLLINEKT